MPMIRAAFALLVLTLAPAVQGDDLPPSQAALEAGIEARQAGDFRSAADHFRRAADLGSDEAAFRLAVMYETGDGVAASMMRALNWYRRAAENGNEKAQFNLGHLYASGRGMEHDPAEAARWYRESARQNNPHAQFALGLMLLLGEEGVARDLVESYKWLTLAVLNFDTNHFRDDASRARRELLEQMNEEQKTEGRRLVDEHRNR